MMKVSEMMFDGAVGDMVITNRVEGFWEVGFVTSIGNPYIETVYPESRNLTPIRCYKVWHRRATMSDWKNCWVINVKNPLDCWLIDEDKSKPIYLENNFPKYDRSRMMQYRLCNHPTEEYQAKHPQKNELDGQISIFDYLEAEETRSVELKGICDDAYCPNCGSPLDDERFLDCERCPYCNIKLDWKLWHDKNDEFCHQCSTCGAFNEVWKASYKACFSATSPNAGRQMKPSDRCEHWEEPEEDWFPEVEGEADGDSE